MWYIMPQATHIKIIQASAAFQHQHARLKPGSLCLQAIKILNDPKVPMRLLPDQMLGSVIYLQILYVEIHK